MDHLLVPGFLRRSAFLVALHKGFFAKEQLEVEFQLVGLAPDHNRNLAEETVVLIRHLHAIGPGEGGQNPHFQV